MKPFLSDVTPPAVANHPIVAPNIHRQFERAINSDNPSGGYIREEVFNRAPTDRYAPIVNQKYERSINS